MTRTVLTDGDAGKPVVDGDGAVVGLVTGVRRDTVFVDPDPTVADRVAAKLGRQGVDQGDHPVRRDRIDAVTDDEIRLKRGL